QLILTPETRTEWRRQVVLWSGGDRETGRQGVGVLIFQPSCLLVSRSPCLVGADLLVQRAGRVVRLDAQVVVQGLAAALVGRQRAGAVAGCRQRAHELAVGLFAPGLYLELAARVAALGRVVAQPLVGGRQCVERVERLLRQLLAHYDRPLLECGAVG